MSLRRRCTALSLRWNTLSARLSGHRGPRFEWLESRRMLSITPVLDGGVLTIHADDHANDVEAYVVASEDGVKELVVRVDNIQFSYPSNEVTHINLFGGGGDDSIVIRPSVVQTTMLDGGAGNDKIVGSMQNDKLYGGAGGDIMDGQDGDDYLDGGEGNDRIQGGFGHDKIDGGAGNDVLIGDPIDAIPVRLEKLLKDGEKPASNTGDDILPVRGNDSIDGGLGCDVIRGMAGQDLLLGGEGNDSIDGGSGCDVIDGQAGDDRIAGGLGDDRLQGGDGNDLLDGGEGNDSLIGDPSDVTPDPAEAAGPDAAAALRPELAPPGGGETNRRFNDLLVGGNGNDTLYGMLGNDRLCGGLGDDTLDGGSGRDTLLGDDGADRLDGGVGNDALWGGRGDDKLLGGLGNDALVGGEGNDTLAGGAGNDWLIGDGCPYSLRHNDVAAYAANYAGIGRGDDLLSGDDGDDVLVGGLGRDQFRGGLGRDFIFAMDGLIDEIWADKEDILMVDPVDLVYYPTTDEG